LTTRPPTRAAFFILAEVITKAFNERSERSRYSGAPSDGEFDAKGDLAILGLSAMGALAAASTVVSATQFRRLPFFF
jgi:hypothetical protein